MKVGQFFDLHELTRTSAPFDNTPSPLAYVNLARLCMMVLDPLRERVGPLRVTSAFRSPAVNRHVGGSEGSFHQYGLAADLQSASVTPTDLLLACFDLPGVDKAIIEFDQWLHVQIAAVGTKPRGEFLRAARVGGKVVYSHELTA